MPSSCAQDAVRPTSQEEEPGTPEPGLRSRSRAEAPASVRRSPLLARHALLIAAGLALPGLVALLLRSDPPAAPAAASAAPARPTAPEAPSLPVAQAVSSTSPVRVCVLPFKNLAQDETLAALSLGLAESVVTDFGQHPGFRLIERGLLDLDLQELAFSNSSHVDPATRAQLGRIAGAEVVVIGSYQRAGPQLRATARFVHVETGEVLETARVEGLAEDPLALQDELALRVKSLLPTLLRRMRS